MASTAEIDFQAQPGWEQLPSGYQHRDVSDVAVDSSDNVYLLTRFDPRVIVYTRAGEFVRSWGEEAFTARPHGISVGPDDMVYVVDEDDQTVRKFTPDGQQVAVIGVSGQASDSGYDPAAGGLKARVSSIVRGAAPFNHPTAVAITQTGELYVSDGYGNARIHHFSAGGGLLHSWGEPGTGPGQFHIPHSLSIDSRGRILVSDRENDRIQLFTPEGDFIEEWLDVQRPAATAITAEGLIVVPELARPKGDWSWRHGVIPDRLPSRLSILDGDGKVLRRLGSAEQPCEPGSFAAPHGITVDSRGDIYVAEVTYSMYVARGPAAGMDMGPFVGDDCHTIQKLNRKGAGSESGAVRIPAPSL